VAGEGAKGNSGFAGKTAGGDVYAGHDGNVYKNTGSGWQKYGNGGWNSMSKPSESAYNQAASQLRSPSADRGSFGGDETRSLQNEFQNRQRGEQSSQRFEQRSRDEGSRFGGERGGGRRR
jgi:hypothetical protein